MSFSWLFVLIPKGQNGEYFDPKAEGNTGESAPDYTREEIEMEPETKLRQFLAQNMIKISMHQVSEDNKYSLFMFCMPTGQVDEGLRKLKMCKIGTCHETSISVMCPSIYLPFETDTNGEGIANLLSFFKVL